MQVIDLPNTMNWATADNNGLALIKPFRKSAGFIFEFMMKEPADFANPKRYTTFQTVIVSFSFFLLINISRCNG
jgi:hypothetical protein